MPQQLSEQKESVSEPKNPLWPPTAAERCRRVVSATANGEAESGLHARDWPLVSCFLGRCGHVTPDARPGPCRVRTCHGGDWAPQSVSCAGG